MAESKTMPTSKPDEWTEAANKAKDAAGCVGEMASHAASAVGEMAGQAACNVGKRVDDLTANAGVAIEGWGDQLSRNTPQSGLVGCATQTVAKAVKSSGEYIEDAKLSGMTADLAVMIRKNPIPAVCIGIGLGWFAARTLRG